MSDKTMTAGPRGSVALRGVRFPQKLDNFDLEAQLARALGIPSAMPAANGSRRRPAQHPTGEEALR